VYEFCFGDREGDPYAEGRSFQLRQQFLEAADFASVRGLGGCEGEVVNI